MKAFYEAELEHKDEENEVVVEDWKNNLMSEIERIEQEKEELVRSMTENQDQQTKELLAQKDAEIHQLRSEASELERQKEAKED